MKYMEKLTEKRQLSSYYIYGIIIITIVLIVLRVLFYFLRSDENLIITGGRDADFILIKGMMDSGLVNFYNNTRMPYLYYWYFIFFPVYILPTVIGVYVWDVLRLISVIYIAKNLNQVTDDDKDLLFFFLFSGVGYIIDTFLNNNNWLILLLLFESLRHLKKDNKILSGILFTFTMYKILLIIFPFALIISNKIKFKDLSYYFIPLIIICIPYLIFWDYTLQMFHSWTYRGELDLFTNIIALVWQLFQTAQLLFMSFIYLIYLTSIEGNKKRVRKLCYGVLISIYFFLIVVFISVPFFRLYG